MTCSAAAGCHWSTRHIGHHHGPKLAQAYIIASRAWQVLVPQALSTTAAAHKGRLSSKQATGAPTLPSRAISVAELTLCEGGGCGMGCWKGSGTSVCAEAEALLASCEWALTCSHSCFQGPEDVVLPEQTVSRLQLRQKVRRLQAQCSAELLSLQGL